jgi:hypothetical protein
MCFFLEIRGSIVAETLAALTLTMMPISARTVRLSFRPTYRSLLGLGENSLAAADPSEPIERVLRNHTFVPIPLAFDAVLGGIADVGT